MTVREITGRLRAQADEAVDAVRSYEQAHKRRKGVMTAAERERARRRRSTSGSGARSASR
jgi:hypothetical protein